VPCPSSFSFLRNGSRSCKFGHDRRRPGGRNSVPGTVAALSVPAPRPTCIMSPTFRATFTSACFRHAVVGCLVVGFVVLSFAGCRGDRRPASSQPLPDPPSAYPAPAAAPTSGSDLKTAANADDSVIWEHLGSWSGHGSTQTESFTGETGSFRIKWVTRAVRAPETKAPAGKAPVQGLFKLTIHSSISGRPLQVAVEQQGPGGDTAYVNEDPRVFFAVVDASNIEWSFSVEEAVGMRAAKKR
jgi:hypothetical protein